MNLRLEDKLALIGVCISSGVRTKTLETTFVDLEETLLEALPEFPKDARLASLIFSWLKIHGQYVIFEKFFKRFNAMKTSADREMIWGHALAAFAVKNGLHKWKKMVIKAKEPVYLFPREVTESAIELKGAISWLEKINFIVPRGAIRIRERDILSAAELIKINRQYRNRYLYGTSWRADIITAIEYGLHSPTEICRLIGCSYEPAHRILREHKMATQ